VVFYGALFALFTDNSLDLSLAAISSADCENDNPTVNTPINSNKNFFMELKQQPCLNVHHPI